MSTASAVNLDGGVAVITGAAGGIGAALAHALAVEGSDLALVDVDQAALTAIVATLRDRFPNVSITEHLMDLSEPTAAEELVSQTLSGHGRITLVINNAGVALGGLFEQVSMADVDWLLSVNLRATMAVTSASLPHLQTGARIVNISSLFGIIAPVGNVAYSASKFGVRGFSLALREELRPRGISVTSVHPGGVRTGIARNARRGQAVNEADWALGQEIFDKLLVMKPADAARIIVRGIKRRKARILIGPEAYVGDFLARIAPVGATRLIGVLMERKSGLRPPR
ncbi:MAG: SDR family NAD(P)-dependent oxidoreductase [Candidatus Nanopelagicales bacterium]